VKEKRRGSVETVAKKLVIVFCSLFVIPTLLSVYLVLEYTNLIGQDSFRIVLLALSVGVLGAGGFALSRSIARTILRAAQDAEAIAGGDLSRRLETNVEGEISELARNFNRITGRLQETIDNLRMSKSQIQNLLSRICVTFGQGMDLANMLEVFLKSLLSLTGYDMGAIFLLSPDGRELTVQASVGIDDNHRSTVVPAGRGIVGWVAEQGKIVTTSDSMPWVAQDRMTALERKMRGSVHVPLYAHGKTRGVMSIGLSEGHREISPEDLQMIQNLATQTAVAIENTELNGQMERTYLETVSALATTVEARDKYTRGHSRRVTEFSLVIARRMNLPEEFIKDLESAGLLHDIGKIGIPDHILHNRGALPPDGLEFILAHPIGGENILKPVGSLGRLCPIVRHHHEKFNGEGYPDRLKGEEIPLAARILSVADSFDAMISDRAYKPTRTKEEAMQELDRCKGTQFDPAIVDVFLGFLSENPEVGVLALS
jgi:HD-GYP domain-containing protein (c-di-GMP phosphodiesterase class II)/HAMP domain-containing protein